MSLSRNRSCAVTNFVDQCYPDLIVSCFVRNECPVDVPIALVNLIECFYSMWKKRHLSSSERQPIKSLTLGQTAIIDLYRLKIKGGAIRISLKVRVDGDKIVRMSLKVSVPPKVEYIAGYFGCCAFGCNQCDAPWNRVNASHSIIELIPYQDVPISEMRSKTELAVSTYLEITQIKYSAEAKIEDFDITPLFKKQGRFQWVIKGEELKRLRYHWRNHQFVKASTIRDGWTFKLIIERSWGSRGSLYLIDLHAEHPFLPLDVGGYMIRFVVRYKDRVMQSEFIYKMYNTQQLGQPLDFAVKSIKGESTIELDVEWELKKLYSMDGAIMYRRR